MKEKWLTFILRLTNLIYQRKQSELSRQGLRSVTNIVVLILLEILLAIVSLPLYLTTSSKKTTAYFAEKGAYAKISVDYNLRKVLTLTGVGVILFIWLIKLLIIILTPAVYGPLQLYQVSDLQPIDLQNKNLILQDTGMQTARVVDSLPMPTISGAEKTKTSEYRFFGTGEAGQEIVMFLVGKQNLVYSGTVNPDGTWEIIHSQKDFRLNNGIHSIFVFHYDKDKGIRSATTLAEYFRVSSSFLERIVDNTDNLANWSVVGIIIIGIILTFLTI